MVDGATIIAFRTEIDRLFLLETAGDHAASYQPCYISMLPWRPQHAVHEGPRHVRYTYPGAAHT